MAFPPMPDGAETERISKRLFDIAVVGATDLSRARAELDAWVFDGQPAEVALLRLHYVAFIAPSMAACLFARQVPKTSSEDGAWVLSPPPGAQPHRATLVVMRAVACTLNGQPGTGFEVIEAALEAGGPEALTEVAVAAIRVLISAVALRGAGR